MSTIDNRIRILHVDDEPDFAEVAAEMLEREDDRLAVETATSVREGLARLDDTDYDCIVSDYHMPGMNGLAFLEAVREEYPDLPFVLYTGKGSEEVASDAISAGVTDYLQKAGGTDQYTVLANRIMNAVEKSRAQRTLTERTRKLETLISNVPGMVYRCRNEPTWPMETVEGEVERLTGYSAEALESDEVLWGEDILHPDDREPMWEAVQEGLSEGGTFEVTYRIVTSDGTRKWMWERGRGVYSETGELEALEGFITDITERVERERELERTNAVLSTLFETLPVGVLAEDTDRNVLAVNERLFELFDLPGSPGEVVGADCARMATEVSDMFVESGRFVTRIDELIAARESVRGEELSLRDGRTFARDYEPLELPDGEGHLWVYRDISDRKQRERHLEQFENLVNAIDDAAFIIDDDWRVVYANAASLDNVRTSLAEVKDRPVLPLVDRYAADDADMERFERVLERAFDADAGTDFSQRLEMTVEADDTSRTFEYQFSPIVTDRRVESVAVVARDITDRKERIGELERQNERLDEFASIVSHDLRSPLNVAEGRLELARTECDSPHLTDIADALDRMERLIDDLLTLARQGEHVRDGDPISLEALSEQCWETVATEEATLDVRTDRTIRADRTRLEQVLENLIRNAIEHGGPDVTVRIGDLADDAGFYVADDGPGIPTDDRDDVFTSGYSTVEGGTGFGLAIVREIVDAHGWDIRVTDSRDGGARFEVSGVESPT